MSGFRLALLASLATCALHPADAGRFRVIKHQLATPTPTPTPTPSAVTYDSAIGNGVDATTGTASLPLRAGANRYYVNSSTGSDANTCVQAKSASAPKATMASGYTCLVDGNGDQLLVAEGTSYSEVLPAVSINGFSPTYPVAIQSYDPADALNEAKYGRATTNRPVVNTGSTATQYITCCMTRPVKYFAVRGFKWGWGNNADQHINILGSNGLSNSYVLFENNVVPYAMLDIEQDLREPSPHVVVRGNTIYGAWSSTNHAQAIYAEAVSGLVIEDNIFWHNGWITTAANRDIGDASGGPTIFNHGVYMQDSSNGLVRRNLFMDVSAAACSCRGMVAENDNVAIDNPVSFIAGLGQNYQYVRPNGEYEFEIGNVAFGDADINSLNPAGDGLKSGNGKLGSRTSYNLIARTRNPSGVNVAGFNIASSVPTPISNVDFHDNVEFSWAAAGQVKSLTDTSGNGTGGFNVTYENNAWSDPASGSNVNIASHTTPNAYTSSTLYAALGLGCTDKSSCITAWLDHPELHPARTINSLLRAGYNVAPTIAEDLALSRNSFILTAPYTSVILGALDGSTITVSGNPACITVDGRSITYDGGCTASSGTFTLIETPLVGSAHSTTVSHSIAAQPTLGTIALSSTIVSGTPATGTFVGGYGGSGVGSGWLAISGTLPSGFVTGHPAGGGDGQGIASHRWEYDGTPFTHGSFTITEYVNGATNSPHSSTISY